MESNRRAFMLGGTAYLCFFSAGDAFGKCGAACQPKLSQAISDQFYELVQSTAVVDVHGHIFNATDLPVLEWLNEVEIDNNIDHLDLLEPIDWAVRKYVKQLFKNKTTKIAKLLRFAPPADCEKKVIDMLLADKKLRSEVLVNGVVSRKLYELIITTAIEIPNASNRRFIRDVCEYFGPQVDFKTISQKSNTANRKKAISTLAENYADLMSRPSLRRDCPQSDTARALEDLAAFSAPLARARLDNFSKWRQTYSIAVAGKPELQPIALFAPAIVDVDYWLRYTRDGKLTDAEEPLNSQPSTIAIQVDVLSGISQLFPGSVAPFVGFDPWREVVEGSAQKNVENAILKGGFVGVKLYPSMGFRPIGNVDFDADPSEDDFPPYVDRKDKLGKQLGKQLDDALLALYRFCLKHDVPIMAHCADSKGPFLDKNLVRVSERSHPKYWERLLSGKFGLGTKGEFKNLRLNLAHLAFGKKEWSDAIGKIMDKFPNVYGDVSYFGEALSTPAGGDACKGADDLATRAVEFLEKSSDKQHSRVRRVMYGSDWFMTATEVTYGSYLNVMSQLYFDKVSGHLAAGNSSKRTEITRDFISGNALRFLGLRSRESNSFKRMSLFFAENPNLNSAEKASALRALDQLVMD